MYSCRPCASSAFPWGFPALEANRGVPSTNTKYHTPPYQPKMQSGMRRFGPAAGTGSPYTTIPFHCSLRSAQPYHSPGTPNRPGSNSWGHGGNWSPSSQGNRRHQSPNGSGSYRRGLGMNCNQGISENQSPNTPCGPRSGNWGHGKNSYLSNKGHQSLNTPVPNGHGSENRGHKRKYHQDNKGSHQKRPRDNPSVNSGGSSNIHLYYSAEMLMDPWLDTPPRQVDYWKKGC